jgi:hypothetical protein
MRNFPVELLKPLPGLLFDDSLGIDIEIPFSPFTLDDALVETSMRLDGVILPMTDLQVLSGQVFHFPVNPEPGYIDGSIYIEHAHHPTNVTWILFGHAEGDSIEAKFQVHFLFEFEGLGDYSNTSATVTSRLTKSTR